jgi:signal transduction histidine kinase
MIAKAAIVILHRSLVQHIAARIRAPLRSIAVDARKYALERRASDRARQERLEHERREQERLEESLKLVRAQRVRLEQESRVSAPPSAYAPSAPAPSARRRAKVLRDEESLTLDAAVISASDINLVNRVWKSDMTVDDFKKLYVVKANDLITHYLSTHDFEDKGSFIRFLNQKLQKT